METNITAWWKDFCQKMNERGIPVPMLRDPKTGIGSVSLTMMVISFNVWLISIVGKAADVLGSLNTDSAFQMFIATASLYFSRNLSFSKGKIDFMEAKNEVVQEDREGVGMDEGYQEQGRTQEGHNSDRKKKN